MRILWLSPFLLHPTNTGGQIRSLGIVRELHRLHEIHFVAFQRSGQDSSVQLASEYASAVYTVPHDPPARGSAAFLPQAAASLFAKTPLAVSRYTSASIQLLLAGVREKLSFDCLVCDFLFMVSNVNASLEEYVLFQHNVETVIWERHAEQARNPITRAFYASQARKMARVEREACRRARHVIAVSDADAQRMRDRFGVSRVSSTPTGVDLEHYAAPQDHPITSDLVFSGGMNWLPNIHGMRWFCAEAWPLIRRKRPQTTLTIVGRDPTPEVLEMGRLPGVTVTGTVDDIRPYLWGSRVSIVPLHIGGGTRLKIYEAMGASLPVVSTTIGAEGLTYHAGEDLRLADTAGDFVAACLELLDNETERRRQAQQARRLVEDHYSWRSVAAAFDLILQATRGIEPGSQSTPVA